MILAWEIHWSGNVWRGDDMTIVEIDKVEAATGSPWIEWNFKLKPQHLVELIVVLNGERNGVSADKTRELLKSLTLAEAWELVHVAEDDLPVSYTDGNPLTADASSTAI